MSLPRDASSGKPIWLPFWQQSLGLRKSALASWMDTFWMSLSCSENPCRRRRAVSSWRSRQLCASVLGMRGMGCLQGFSRQDGRDPAGSPSPAKTADPKRARVCRPPARQEVTHQQFAAGRSQGGTRRVENLLEGLERLCGRV